MLDEKITIIEGPPPTFEAVNDGWVLGLTENTSLAELALTRVRTFNGPALVERCHRAWRNQEPIHLEYRDETGLTQTAPIVATRFLEVPDGHLLLLWVRLYQDELGVELGLDDDFSDDVDDDSPTLDF